MKGTIKIFVLIIILFGLISCTGRPRDPESVVKAFIEAFNDNELEAALSYLAEDIFLMIYDECSSGDEVRAIFTEWIEDTEDVNILKGGPYYVTDEEVEFLIRRYVGENLAFDGFKTFTVQDGRIQFDEECERP